VALRPMKFRDSVIPFRNNERGRAIAKQRGKD
jgi:hypothetical protein